MAGIARDCDEDGRSIGKADSFPWCDEWRPLKAASTPLADFFSMSLEMIVGSVALNDRFSKPGFR